MIDKINNIYLITPDRYSILENSNIDLIISLTSYGNRLVNILPTLLSLINLSTRLKFRIVLNIYKDDIQLILPNIRVYCDLHNIEIFICSNNLKSHLKYFYTMLRYKNIPIITVDDDNIYYNNLIDLLYTEYCKYPKCILARRVHKITFNSTGKLNNYDQWKYEYLLLSEPSFELFATGVGGVLYPPNILNLKYSDICDIKNALTADDVYLKYKELKLNVPVKFVYDINKLSYQKLNSSVDATALWRINKINNDIIIANFNFDLPKKYNYDKINIVYILDNNYLLPTYNSLKSLVHHSNLHISYNIYILYTDLTRIDINYIRSLLHNKNITIILIDVTDLLLTNIPKIKIHVTATSLIKFKIADILNNIDKCLYIDGDTIINSDLLELYNHDISLNSIAAVLDIGVHLRYKNSFHVEFIKQNQYFNSGVMLMNLMKIRKNNAKLQLINYRLTGTNKFMDLDALNVVFKNDCILLNLKYNYMTSILSLFNDTTINEFFNLYVPIDTINIKKYAHILHFTGPEKPWKNNIQNELIKNLYFN